MAKPDRWGVESVPVAAGDPGAVPLSADHASLIARLYGEHADTLRRYIAGRFGSGPPEPEEVAQAAFAKFAGQADISAVTNPRGFLFTIACNIVTDHHRRARYRDGVQRDLMIHNEANSLSELSPERVLLGKEQFAVFEAALQKMPAMRRRIFLMVRNEGLQPAELARRFGITENAVHKHVSRALADCAVAFEKADRDWEGRL